MSPRNPWFILTAGSILVCGSLAGLVHGTKQDITAARAELAQKQQRVQSSRETVRETPELERELIALRELSSYVEEILPPSEDLKSLIEDLKDYLQEADVKVDSFGLRPDRPCALTQNTDIDRIGYTLTFDGGLFEFLRFLTRIESDQRFMSVRSFKLVSSTREEMEREGRALHHIQVDIETYTYRPEDAVTPVTIESYERKRDLLVGVIGTRAESLRPHTYHFSGGLGRRDPWVDLRVPALGEEGGPTVQEQVKRVESLIEQVEMASEQWAATESAAGSVDRMIKRGTLVQTLAILDEDLRRLSLGFEIRYVPARRRLELEVLEPRERLRKLLAEETLAGPTLVELNSLKESMLNHLAQAEFSLAIEAFASMKPNLGSLQEDPDRWSIVEELMRLDHQARAAFDFGQLELEFGGSVIIAGLDAAVIVIHEVDGLRQPRSYSVGDLIFPDLEVAAIRPGEVAFYFRGYELTRVY